MAEVENILNYIDSIDNKDLSIPKVEKQEEKQEEEKEKQEEEKAQEDKEPENLDIKPYSAYKNDIAKMRRLLNKNKFPCVFDGKAYNSREDLENFRNEYMRKRKEEKNEKLYKKIEASKMNFDELSEESDDINLLTPDNKTYYKTPSLHAIKDKNGKIRKLPKTSPEDRKIIYNEVKKNKENLKKLIREEDPEEFKKKTIESLNDDIKPIYEKHTINDITKDNTWTHESLIKFMTSQMNKPKRTPKPSLFGPQIGEQPKPKTSLYGF